MTFGTVVNRLLILLEPALIYDNIFLYRHLQGFHRFLGREGTVPELTETGSSTYAMLSSHVLLELYSTYSIRLPYANILYTRCLCSSGCLAIATDFGGDSRRCLLLKAIAVALAFGLIRSVSFCAPASLVLRLAYNLIRL